MESWFPGWVAGLCVLCGGVAVVVRPKALVTWLFFGGMSLLAIEQLLVPRLANSTFGRDAGVWLWRFLLMKSLVAGIWLAFSLVYARGNRAEFLRRWKWLLLAALVVPPAILLFFSSHMAEAVVRADGVALRWLPLGKFWVLAMVLITLGILTNLEKTFRASVGMSRWRIKYLFLGVGLIFGVKLYTLSQLLLFSGYDPGLARLESIAVGLGCLMVIVGHTRSSFGAFDLYPSRAVLQGSLTVILAGGYFLLVGVGAQAMRLLGGAQGFPAQAFVLLLGMIGLTVLLLSDRFRTGLQRFVSRHFRRAEHDFRKIWTEFTRRTSSARDAESLGKNAGEVISENFHVLGVTVFQITADMASFALLSSTEKRHGKLLPDLDARRMVEIGNHGRPFNLEKSTAAWAETLRMACPTNFDHGGDRLVVPLVATERFVGLIVLTDRVNGVPYSDEELDLLACIGDQLAAALLNTSLTDKVLQAKEMEAFQTLSTFFVHDLKNAANSLNLTLQNLPIHFDDPDFRADAVRTVGRTVERINQMIVKLGSLRHELELRREPCRLDLFATGVLGELDSQMGPGCVLQTGLDEVPELRLDLDAIRSVITNLVVNAREAMTAGGIVRVATTAANGQVYLTVTDDGHGMDEEFIRNGLFRPFHSTKTKGLGIGMFQCKKIIEAHGGVIRVDSSPSEGTTFTISFPTHPEISADTRP
jgi:putative PEP-CTERM system histidine kinase